MRKRYLLLAWLCACSVVAAEDLPLLAECTACHGERGQSQSPDTPILAGLSVETFVQAMKAYQTQKRPPHPLAFKPYSKTELEKMGAFFAAQAFVPTKQEKLAHSAARGRLLHRDYCEKCHENQGRTDKRGVSILAGQWMPYLRQTMQDYRNRKREMPKAMRERLDVMLDAHGLTSIEDLIQYYASLE